MKTFKGLHLLLYVFLFWVSNLCAQVGYYDAPYVRYEADQGTLSNASATSKSFNQYVLQSEASGQVCVDMTNAGASVQWTVSASGSGLVVRYNVPDGQSGVIEVFNNGTSMGTLNLTSYYSWESLWNNGDPNNSGVTNQAPKMRFDEVRMKMSSAVPAGGTLKLVRVSGNVYIDFAELEPVPAAVASAAGEVYYSGNGSDLQNVINNNGGKTIYLPAGVYNVPTELYFGNNNTTLKGAGMWYTQINFTETYTCDGGSGGLRANASNISYSGLYLTTVRNSRSCSYKAINGVYTSGSTITNVWAEHFECGAWIGQYNTGGPGNADGFNMNNCRFRNNYADGTNLCKGTVNAIVEHCSYRNNGDDDMAIWSANGQECRNNIFRFNTSENTWRSAGLAIYGGYSNQGYNLLIQDNVEVGVKVNNAFGGAPFNTGGMHLIYNIWIKRCGTNYDLFNRRVGAIDLGAYNWGAGTWVRNVKFSCITITDSKNDAIYINKIDGDGFANLDFENITIDGTGREYPDNGGTGSSRGFMVLFNNYPGGDATYCGMTYLNRGGNASSDVNTSQQGPFSWTVAGSCPTGCTAYSSSSTTITSTSTFGICTNPVTLTATTVAPSGSTVNYIEFFVDGVSIGQDNTSTYSMNWTNPTIGTHSITAVAHYSNGTTSTSSVQSLTVTDEIYSTTSAPTIDGSIDALWNGYSSFTIGKLSQGSIGGASDLSATFKVTRDATNLYLLVNVTDDVLRNDGAANWQDDGLELFIDMGNTKSSSYGSNDFAYNFVYNNSTVYENQHNATAGVTFAQGTKAGGYILEIRIPWSTLGGTPAAGSFIGLDLGIDDNDTGTRDAKIDWNDATDNAWQNPSLFGTLQISNCSNPLPVNIIAFTGAIEQGSVRLNWVTTSELTTQEYQIEHSNNSSIWSVKGNVAAVGNSFNTYQFTDNNPDKGTNYYRIKQIDVNGNLSYSDVLAINVYGSTLSITPNPFNEFINISFVEALNIEGNLDSEVDVSIHDLLGKLWYHSNVIHSNGAIHIEPELPTGTYIISVQSQSFVEQMKVIKR